MKYFSILIFLITIIGCSEKKESSQPVPDEQSYVPDMHTSENSLDWAGTYSGTLPCASCPGIETTLSLTEQGTYSLTLNYLESGDSSTFKSSGSFSWSYAGDKITLDDEDVPNQYFVGENYLAKLDKDGKRATGDLAEHYILKKE